MHVTVGRRSRLAALGACLIAAGAVSISASGTARADTTDTGGTASVSLTRSFLLGLARSNVIILPGSPTTSSYASDLDAYTLPVTGGDGEVSIFFGQVHFGGTLTFVNAKARKAVTITKVRLNFFTGALTGDLPGSAGQTALAYFGGDESTSSQPGPPATESFSASQLNLSGKAAKALNSDLHTTVFVKGTNIGTFTTTFDVSVS